MDTAQLIATWLAGLLFAIAVVIILRRMLVTKLGGFDLSWRAAGKPVGRGWVLGQARYRSEHLSLYRAFQVMPRASRRLSRKDLELGSQRHPTGVEVDVLAPGAVIIDAALAGERLELAMSEQALDGVRSWLEAAPGAGR